MSNKITFSDNTTLITLADNTTKEYPLIKFVYSPSLKAEIERVTDTAEDKEYTFDVHAKTKKIEVNLYIQEGDQTTRRQAIEDFQDELANLSPIDIEITSINKTYANCYIDSIDVTDEDNKPIVEIKLTFAMTAGTKNNSASGAVANLCGVGLYPKSGGVVGWNITGYISAVTKLFYSLDSTQPPIPALKSKVPTTAIAANTPTITYNPYQELYGYEGTDVTDISVATYGGKYLSMYGTNDNNEVLEFACTPIPTSI